jgi:zinc/manganese transport system permease protein
MNPLASIAQAIAQPFMANALLAGTAIAVAAGLAGYFLVLRSQVFTSDALGHVAFVGAAAALAFGLDARIGLFAATVAVGVLIGALGRNGRSDDVVIGNVLAWVLGLGVFFLTLYVTSHSAGNGAAGVSVLFGSILGLGREQAVTAALVAGGVAAALIFIARPLLFASIDENVASSLGVPVRALGIVFLALCGVVTAEASQAVGALLLLGLLAAPAGTAQRLTTRPFAGLALSAGVAVFDMWAGLALSSAVPALPPSFSIVAVATFVYFAAIATAAARRGSEGRELRG